MELLQAKKDKRDALSEIDSLNTRNRELTSSIHLYQEQDTTYEYKIKELENELRDLKDDSKQAILSKDIQIRRLEQEVKSKKSDATRLYEVMSLKKEQQILELREQVKKYEGCLLYTSDAADE